MIKHALRLAPCLLLALASSCLVCKIPKEHMLDTEARVLTNLSSAQIAGTQLSYQVLLPPRASLTEDGLPLLLFLHGAGERGTDVDMVGIHGPLKHVAKFAELQECVIVAPQCPSDAWWEAGALKEVVDNVRSTYPIDDARIYVTGLSMGGYGTWDLLSRYPDFFAAAVPICGGGDITRLWDGPSSGFEFDNLMLAKDVPIHAYHGDADGIIPVAESRLLVDALHEVGSSATLTIYPGVGHKSWVQTYDDPELYKWLFAQRRSVED